MSEQVIHNPAASRYEMPVDGHLAIADYRRDASGIAVTHVEVPPELRNRGLAAMLMQGLLVHARAQGWKVTPICPYAVSYMQRHPQE